MRRVVAATAGPICAAALLCAPAAASATPAPDPRNAAVSGDPDRVRDPDRTLGVGWRTSADRAVTGSGDETAFHLLVADARHAYQWRTVASLAEPGVVTDQWLGQFCLTGSGQRAVVVYAPRQFANKDTSMQRGGFAAVVDLRTGAVTKLAERVSLAYHNPGCGAGETAVLSRLERTATTAATWLGTVDTTRPGRITAVRTPGQVTSTLPYGGGLLGVKGHSLVRVARDGRITTAADLPGSPFRLVADGAGAVAFQVARGENTDLSRYAGGRTNLVATVPMGTVKLRPGAGGKVFAVGGRARTRTAGRLPSGWRALDAVPDSTVSTTGALVVTRAGTGREAAGHGGHEADGLADQVRISAKLADGRAVTFGVRPSETALGRKPSPALAGAGAGVQGRSLGEADYSHITWDPDRACAVPRNDPSLQVFQPTTKQVEWAADLAVRGMLTFQRPANWANNGMAAYSPQGLFPSIPLLGGGRVPAQVMLGILAQESNLWQASSHVVDASAGNPLISSGFYGIPADGGQDPRTIDWARADCGYGVAQVTTGMRKADTNQTVNGVVMDYTKQKLVALDYAVNISAGLRILQDKWNTTRAAGLIANDGDPRYLENWWFAIWAYNTGFYPQNGTAPWGLGWGNNVANQDYPADRQMFLTAPLDVPDPDGDGPARGYDDDIGYDNAKHPNHWTYPERVIGFGYTSVVRFKYDVGEWGPTYNTALTAGANRFFAQPGRFQFCSVAVNECDPAAQHVPADYPGTAPGACLRDDLLCRWHAPVTWANCATLCGQEQLRYLTVEPRPYVEEGDNIYPTPVNPDGTCKVAGLPAGAKIIDDIHTTVAIGADGCRPTFTRGGSFGFTFGSMTGQQGSMVYPSKVDFHQIGAGFGGHFWFSHTITSNAADLPLKVTGTWTINPTGRWTRVFVHLPDHGAHTRQADYKIYLPGQTVSNHHRAIPTRLEANTWLELGVFDFRAAGTPRVELSNVTSDGAHTQDIAWDAIAVQPLNAKPRHFVVGLGDSYSSGEGTGSFTRVSDQYGDDPANRNACHRSPDAWARRLVIPNSPGSATIGTLSDQHDVNLDFHHLACSGALTHNVMATKTLSGAPAPVNKFMRLPEGKYGELTQIDQGFLDENTTLVVLSIGGNDAGWTAVVQACLEEDCLDPNYKMYSPSDPMSFKQRVEYHLRDLVGADVRRVMTEIHERAPAARIVLAGYPQLFTDGYSLALQLPDGTQVGLTAEETAWLNQLAEVLATEVVRSDPALKLTGVDIRPAFSGHEVGDPLAPRINSLILGDKFELLPDEDGQPSDAWLSSDSFHPNNGGQIAYAQAVTAALPQVPYAW
jgi:lysophospholipase L1-like esterase